MSAAEKYLVARRWADKCQAWAEMLGKTYHGGGGGVGELRYLGLGEVTLYYQESHGSQNYHDAPDALRPALQAAIRTKFPELLADAMHLIDAGVQMAAQEALREHEELMRAAKGEA